MPHKLLYPCSLNFNPDLHLATHQRNQGSLFKYCDPRGEWGHVKGNNHDWKEFYVFIYKISTPRLQEIRSLPHIYVCVGCACEGA